MWSRWRHLPHEHKSLPHQNPHTPSRPQYIQTTHPQPNKRNSPWWSHSHTLYAFQIHNRHGHHGIFTPSQEYTNISLLWVTKNTQARLFSPPYCVRTWWSNSPSLILYYPLHPLLANNLLSHIKDTKHFLNLTENLPKISKRNVLSS